METNYRPALAAAFCAGLIAFILGLALGVGRQGCEIHFGFDVQCGPDSAYAVDPFSREAARMAYADE